MGISNDLAYEIYTISIFHITALLVLFSFSLSIYYRSKKTPLLYSYLVVVAMISIWMLSKLLKTLAPTADLRWFFIVTQYFGIDFLGLCLVAFAYIYTKNRIPSKNQLILWSILPLSSFFIVMTNPLHMRFYSYFDFYKDQFGSIFYGVQSVQYAYLLAGIIILSRGYTKQPVFQGKRAFSIFFAFITLIPLFANVYYILFKMDVLPWVFSFPVFDFTPIAGTVALILFMIPAVSFRFFDMSSLSYGKLFEILPQGIVFLNKKLMMYGGNSAFYDMFNLQTTNIYLNEFVEHYLKLNPQDNALHSFLSFSESDESELVLENGNVYKIRKTPQKNGNLLLHFTDITVVTKNRILLSEQNAKLSETNRRLDSMAEKTKDLSVAKAKAQMAQNVHDILGHSLTVVIGTAELAATEDISSAKSKLAQIDELLTSSLNDLKSALTGEEYKWGQTSLTKTIEHLKNENVQLDITIHGTVYELSSAQTETIFRLCQESVTNAIKHGKAKNIYIILRYRPSQVEVFTIDDGIGCSNIVKSYGLKGIEERVLAQSGRVDFGSDGENGFTVHAILPK